MRALLQRVTHAEVTVEEKVIGRCGRGLLIFLGVGAQDSEEIAARMAEKISSLRIFEDSCGKMNRSAKEIEAEALVVSQFTLYANCRRGNRPDFFAAAPPQEAERLYGCFVEALRKTLDCAADPTRVQTGQFGAHMQVSLCNDGPVTLWLDSEEWMQSRKKQAERAKQ